MKIIQMLDLIGMSGHLHGVVKVFFFQTSPLLGLLTRKFIKHMGMLLAWLLIQWDIQDLDLKKILACRSTLLLKRIYGRKMENY